MKDLNRDRLLESLGIVNEGQSTLSDSPLIEIDNLSVNFKRSGKLFEAVKNANININQNDILGVVGESGSGKTTLGRATISLWDHANGEVRIEGKQLPKKRIKSVSSKNVWVYEYGQMIFQDPTSSLNRKEKVLNIVSEGLKNFDTITKEAKEQIKAYREEILELKEQIKVIESYSFREEFYKKEYSKKEIKNLVSTTNNSKFVEYLADFNRYVQLKERIEELDKSIGSLKANAKNDIKIDKAKTKSEKIARKEDTLTDKTFFNNTRKEIKDELKDMSERYNKNSAKVVKRINKRISLYNDYIKRRVETFDPKLVKQLKFTNNENDIEANKKVIQNIIDKNQKNKVLVVVLENIINSFNILLKKIETPVSEYNTRAFDFIYKHVDDKTRERVNHFIKLKEELDVRHKIEVEKLKNVSTSSEKKAKEKAISYLEEYSEYLESIIGEYRFIRSNYKRKTIESVKTSFDYIKRKNVRLNLLMLSITTWKTEEKKGYIKRNLNLKLEAIDKELSEGIRELNELDSKYSFGILHSLDNLKEILSKELEAIKNKANKLNVTKATKEEIESVKGIQANIDLIELKITIQEDLLKNKQAYKKEIKDRVIDILKTVGLNEDAVNKYPDQFSGGQKQRIGIARTLITNPKFIIADEPISALDVSVQAQVINLLKKLHKDLGLTMIFIAHDLEMVHYISNKIVVIYRGNIVEYGDADEVYKKPIHPYTKSLIAAMPSLKEIGKSLKVSDYRWDDHNYNEFSHPTLKLVGEDHFVFGTEDEIKQWKK